MAPAETTAVAPMIDGLRQLHADVRRCWTRDGMFEALARSFTLLHKIDAASPLNGMTPPSLTAPSRRVQFEIIE